MTLRIIQGGMGVGVSDWRLARAVSQCGQLGVVSGTGLATLMLRKLQQGDADGRLRQAFAHFPDQDMARRIWDRYHIAGGKSPVNSYELSAMPALAFPQSLLELAILSSFVEVFLAKTGHTGVVGINLLEKIQTPTLATLFGAMLADVDYVLMGAGIPRHIPGVLDKFAQFEPAELKIDVEGALPEDHFAMLLDPRQVIQMEPRALKRPQFLAIISSATLAMTLARKSNGRVDGFIIEGSCAGGHNAPPRGQLQLNASGEPVYGERDKIDLAKIRDLELPFWLAGGYGTPEQLAAAVTDGAQGVQIGTAFAFCEESAITPELKLRVILHVRSGEAHVKTDPLASPTGYPFKVLELNGTLSDDSLYEERSRLCDLGYMRQLYRRENGTIGYRCSAEPLADYLAKGGKQQDTVGRKCLCNALFSTIGLGQQKNRVGELPIITAGDDVAHLARYLEPNQTTYHASDVVTYVLGGLRHPLTRSSNVSAV